MGRRLAVAAVAILSLAWSTSARAESVCDPDGHFCIHIDTTSASVCDLLRPGTLNPDACSVQDATRREKVRAWSPRPMRVLTIRFDDWWVFATVTRIGKGGELPESALDSEASRTRAELEKQADSIDSFAPPTTRRINGVQTIWFDTLETAGGGKHEQIDVEVRAADASYDVSFHGPPGARLQAFADNALATLDALPAKPPHGPGEAITWTIRALLIAAVLAVAGWWLGKRRKRGGLDSRDLWPRG
jgi:hypothetical protein